MRPRRCVVHAQLAGAEALKTDFLPYVKKSVGGRLKTKKSPNMINCRGGGGFRVAHLSPACFDYNPDLGLVTLTEVLSPRGTTSLVRSLRT